MTQTGLNDEYLIVCWFGKYEKQQLKLKLSNDLNIGNNDSWFEIYKLVKDQWKSEIATQEQVNLGI